MSPTMPSGRKKSDFFQKIGCPVIKLLNKLREPIKEKTNTTWPHNRTSMLASQVSHRLRLLGPTTLPQPPGLPLQSTLRVHGSAKPSTLRVHSSVKPSTLALLRKASILFVEFGLLGLCHASVFPWTKQGVCHIVTLPFTLKSILLQKKNYETQIFHHAKI
jgi:hypothetical protein